jgi:hypothetical protein
VGFAACFSCRRFDGSLSETIDLGSFEFIADYFGGLSLSPMSGDSGAAFMGYTRSETPSPRRAMIEDSIKAFLTTSSGEGGSSLPSPRRRGVGAPPVPVTTTPWMVNALTTQAMMTVPPRTVEPRSNTGVSFEQWRACQEGQRSQACAWSSRTCHHSMGPRLRWKGS